MNVKNAIKGSYLFYLLGRLGYVASNSRIFNISLNQGNRLKDTGKRSWMESSAFYRLMEWVDSILQKVDKWLNKALSESMTMSWIVAGRRKSIKTRESAVLSSSVLAGSLTRIVRSIGFSDLLAVSIGFYMVIDYVVRRLPGISAIGSVWDELLLLFVVFYVVLTRVRSNGKIRLNLTPMDLPVLIYLIIGITHVFIRALDLSVAIEGFRAVFQHILWYFAATQLIRDEDTAGKVVDGMILMGLFLGLHAIYQYVMKVPMPGNWVDTAENITTRAYSIIGSPNILGVIFVLVINITMARALSSNGWKHRVYYGGSALIMLAGLLFTMSRGAWLAFAFGVGIFTLILVPKLIIPLSGVGAGFVLFGGTLSERLLYMMSPVYLMKSAAGGRLYRWAIGYELWTRNKLFGVGLGRFGGAVAINNRLAPFYLDNYYLKTLVEMGIYGVAGLLFVIICFIVSSLRAIGNQHSIKGRIMTIGLFSGAMGVLAQNFVENIFEVPGMVVYFWLTVALINAYGKFRNVEAEGRGN